MFGMTFKLLVAFSGGIAAALQATLASLMGQRVGSMASVFVVHLGGTLLAGALLLGQGGGNIAQWRTVPWYALGAGTLGVGILSAINYSIQRLGVGTTITLFVAAQLRQRIDERYVVSGKQLAELVAHVELVLTFRVRALDYPVEPLLLLAEGFDSLQVS